LLKKASLMKSNKWPEEEFDYEHAMTTPHETPLWHLNETTRKMREGLEQSSFAAPDSSATCCSCAYWEHGQTPRLIAVSGYCPVFDKKTWAYHGEKCTAHSVTGSPNEKAQRSLPDRDAGRKE
jgi:hypothetical protein